jgi:Ca2+/Na+ antiporter
LFNKNTLSNRQLRRVKIASALVSVITAFSLIAGTVAEYSWKGTDYLKREDEIFSRGRTTYFTNNDEFCTSFILTPAWNLQSRYLNGVLYLLCLIFIFVGVSIISDNFMDAITVITSAKRVANLRDANGNVINKEVDVWNATVANLTLMALGSSAPEIMLNVIETLMTLGQKPGELGPSTIVGSAAFNLLVISGVSILAVNEDNDERDEEELIEDGTPKGVKKIEKVPVFILTTIFSIVAYVWMWYVLYDEKVEIWEAWVTFGLFWILIGAAYGIDLCIAKNKIKPQGEELPVLNMKEFIQVLKEAEDVPEEKMEAGALQRTKTLKKFLSDNFETEDVNKVDYAQLKEKVEGVSSKSRSEYRKGFMDAMSGKKPKIKKGEQFKREENLAKNLSDKNKNGHFGFWTLNYTVSEACKEVSIKVLNKTA